MKILVADDHALMREGIHIVLQRFNTEFQFLEAGDYDEALETINKTENLDLILLDLNMPGYEPFIGLNKVLRATPGVPLVIISGTENPAEMHQAIELGARGFIPKSETNDTLQAALELILTGGQYIPAQLFNYANNSATISDETAATENSEQVKSTITRRQKEVLTLLAQGQANKEIGKTLGLSEGTVRTHITTIFRLLDVKNRTLAGNRARQLGLIDDTC